MPRREIPFCGPAYELRNNWNNVQECVNYFLEQYPAAAGTKWALRGCPGLEEWADVGIRSPVRGMLATEDYLYAVIDKTVFKFDSDGDETEIGNLNTAIGLVSMARNPTQIMIVDRSGAGYILTIATDALAEIADADFPEAESVTFQDGYFIVHQADQATFNISALNDGESWDALDFHSAAWKPDDIVRIFSYQRDLYIFGSLGTEVWYWNGSATAFPYSRRDGTEIEMGLSAKDAPGSINNAILWLGQDEHGYAHVIRSVGFQPQIVSSPAVTEAINSYSTISDAIGLTYWIDKHPMYEIIFPTEDKSWCFDLSMQNPDQAWHERMSRRQEDDGSITRGRHRINCNAFFAGKQLVGDYSNGKIYEHSRDAYDEDGTTMEAIRTTAGFNANQDLISVSELGVLYGPGVGLVSGQGSDPLSIISWSHDGGKRWSNEHQVSIGKIGEYENRARVLQCGQGRNWVVRAKITDPVERDILGGYSIFEVDDA